MTEAKNRFETQWPDLFDTLNAEQKKSVSHALANGILEGWEPSYEEVKNLVLSARGDMSTEEYLAKARAAAKSETPQAARG